MEFLKHETENNNRIHHKLAIKFIYVLNGMRFMRPNAIRANVINYVENSIPCRLLEVCVSKLGKFPF